MIPLKSIDTGSEKLSEKKNWGCESKGISLRFIDVDSFAPAGPRLMQSALQHSTYQYLWDELGGLSDRTAQVVHFSAQCKHLLWDGLGGFSDGSG